jgi:hypothetical protein
MDIIWDGTTKSETIREEKAAVRHKLADKAKEYDWQKVFEILGQYRSLINTTRPDGQSLYAPLHQAAYGNASVEIVQKMINMGAWRTLKNADGERAVDIAQRKKYLEIGQLLQPIYKVKVPSEILKAIESRFHEIILDRAGDLIYKASVRLPDLEILLEIEEPKMWFPIPGMYGGFSYWLDIKGQNIKLISESWSRIIEGSGQRHEIDNDGWLLVESSFV